MAYFGQYPAATLRPPPTLRSEVVKLTICEQLALHRLRPAIGRSGKLVWMSILRSGTWVCALCLAVLSGHPVDAQSGKPELRRLEVAGHSRVYTVETLGGPRRALRPILVELHGTGTDVRENLKNRFFPNFTTVSNIEPVIIVRPQGAARVWDVLPGKFEDWRRLAGTDGVQVDDVVFLRAVLADVTAKDGGDPTRVFLYGISVGGQMAARAACEMADEFRAVAAMLATARHTSGRSALDR